MSYYQAKMNANEAARLADVACRQRNDGEPDRAFESLALAVADLARAVSEMAQTMNHES